MVFGKIMKQKMLDEEEVKDTWYRGIVTQVLGDNERSHDCDFTVMCKGFEDIYDAKLIEEWKNQCANILGKDDEKKLQIMKITRPP